MHQHRFFYLIDSPSAARRDVGLISRGGYGALLELMKEPGV